jgi:hypothetical protein
MGSVRRGGRAVSLRLNSVVPQFAEALVWANLGKEAAVA